MERLSHIVSSTNSHIGIMIDTGSEKIFCVDEHGSIISSERLSVLVTKLYLQCYEPGKIAAPVSIPAQVESFCREKGVEVVHTATDGGALIKSTEDPDVRYAVGTMGGFVFSDFHFSFDGMFAAVKLLELMARTGELLGELDAEVARLPYRGESIVCPWESKGRIMRRLIEYSDTQERLLVDGVKLIFENSWLLVLPDPDKALCHLIAEGDNIEHVKKLLHSYASLLQAWIDQEPAT
jgi:mannose-1-phosphate guanylyltransferase/phosphomannomutase